MSSCYAQGLGFYSISTICKSAKNILELFICIQIQTIQLLIFTEKFSPLPGFEPGPPRYQADMLPIELSWLGWPVTSLVNTGNKSLNPIGSPDKPILILHLINPLSEVPRYR